MEEREIVGVREDSNRTATGVAVLLTVEEAWTQSEKEEVSYYIMKNGQKTRVYGRTSTAGRKFLTTNPNATQEDNLDLQTKV